MGEAATVLILGGAGDLALRKLLPALARLGSAGKLPSTTSIIAAGRRVIAPADYLIQAANALAGAGMGEADAQAFLKMLSYRSVGTRAGWEVLADHVRGHERHLGAVTRVIYLALPPAEMAPALDELARVGLTAGQGPVRVVVEKPFGHDLASAQALNAQIHAHVDESAVYRIDHYLGKDTVQNLLVLRFANAIFESVWHRERIESVEILVAEADGVGRRAGYYDTSGAVRDMLQNHLLQILTLVAMEVPARMQADAIRHEKLKVLQSLVPLTPDNLVLGQYGPGAIAGAPVPGYLAEPGVRPGSATETFAALRVELDNWRWQGVPFYLVTGKRLPRRVTRIVVRFRGAPVCLFKSFGACRVSPNVLVITLQPDEGFSLHMDVKVPGGPVEIRNVPLSFAYSDIVDGFPEAYETLLRDVLEGDQTLFVHAAEVEHAWRFFAPLGAAGAPVHPYPAGTWGPSVAQARGFVRRLPGEVGE